MNNKGVTLLEALITTFIFGIILTSIGSLYVTHVRSYHRLSFDTFSQQEAQAILGSITADIQSAVRIIQPNTTVAFPLSESTTGGVPFITFTQDPNPMARRFTYRFLDGVIFFYEGEDNPPPLNARRRFVSDSKVEIQNFEVWAAPVEVTIRLTLRDPQNLKPNLIRSSYVSLRYYN